jgi:cell division protein FtsA
VEAKYQQIVARPSIRRSVTDSLSKQVGIAGIIVSPLALADTVLSVEEKKMGCALVDFGAGVTSVAVYKNGRLLGLSIIPLGGDLLTKDLSKKLKIVESDAEKNKYVYGRAIVDEEDMSTFSLNSIDRKELQSIYIKDFNAVIAARQQEIIENVSARIKDIVGEKEAANIKDFLPAGLITTGNAAKLELLDEAIYRCINIDVHVGVSIRKELQINLIQKDIVPDATLIGLLLQGYENCSVLTTVKPPVVTPPPPVVTNPIPEPAPAPEPEPPKPPKEGKEKKENNGLWTKLKKKAEGMNDLFAEN